MTDINLPSKDHSDWKDRSTEEVGFWKAWIRSGGMKWKEGFQRKTNPNAELAPLVKRFLPEISVAVPGKLEILDIGSGPLSWVGTQHPDYEVALTAVDPLADEYNAELDGKGVNGVLRPIKGYFESALWQLGPAKYDFVWCANSLDHSIDPVIGLYNIMNVCRIGGGVLLMFHPNEAEGEDYKGLHQWNLNIDNRRLTLTRRGKVFDMMSMLDGQSAIQVLDLGGTEKDKSRLVVFFRKERDCNLSELLVR